MASEQTLDHTPAPSRAFLDALEARRELIYRHVKSMPQGERAADFVFDLLTRLANKGRLDVASISTFHSKSQHLEVPPSELEISLPDGITLSLEQCLTFGAPPPSTHEVLSALLGFGLNRYLKRKAPEERRAVIKRVVKLLPGVERLGPFVLTDFVDYCCETQEATMFWQLYVDHVAKVIDQRTSKSAEEDEPPVWTLSALIELERNAPNALMGRRWELVRRHINRIIQCPQPAWRWRFARVLIEKCHDQRLLYYIVTSPALIEDEQVLFKFLTRCHSKHISSALFMLQVGPASRDFIDELLQYFDAQGLLDMGERVLDIYTQIQLIERPSRTIALLKEALLGIITHKLESEPVDILLGWVKNNANAFRQCRLLIDLVALDRSTLRPRDHQLLERVLQSFFHAFTPLGVRHPLNNIEYHDCVISAIVGLMRDEQSGHAATIQSFSQSLPAEAQRWLPDEEDEPKRRLLLTYFMGLLAQVLRRAARRLYASGATRERAIELYLMMIELFCRHPQEGTESGAYGSLLTLVQSLYPELLSQEYMEPPAPERLRELAELFALVEEELLSASYLDSLLDQWRDRNRGRELVEAVEEPEPEVSAPSTPHLETGERVAHAEINVNVPRTLKAPVVIIPRRQSDSGGTLRAFLGLDLFAYLGQQILRLVGVKRLGDLIATPENIVIRQHHQGKEGETLAQREVTFPYSQVAELSISQPLMRFHYTLGFLTLCSSTLLGGYLLFAGLRGAEHSLTFISLFLFAFGILFDLAAHKRAQVASRRVIVEVSRVGKSKSIAVALDRSTEAGQAMINALTSREALKNEADFQQDWESLAAEYTLEEEASKAHAAREEQAAREAEQQAIAEDRAQYDAEMADIEPPAERPFAPPVIEEPPELDDEDDEGEEPRVVVSGSSGDAFERMTSAEDYPQGPDNGTLVAGYESLSMPPPQLPPEVDDDMPPPPAEFEVPQTPAPPLPFDEPSLPPPPVEADEEAEVYPDFSTAPTEFASSVDDVGSLLGMMVDETPAVSDEDIGNFDTILPSVSGGNGAQS